MVQLFRYYRITAILPLFFFISTCESISRGQGTYLSVDEKRERLFITRKTKSDNARLGKTIAVDVVTSECYFISGGARPDREQERAVAPLCGFNPVAKELIIKGLCSDSGQLNGCKIDKKYRTNRHGKIRISLPLGNYQIWLSEPMVSNPCHCSMEGGGKIVINAERIQSIRINKKCRCEAP